MKTILVRRRAPAPGSVVWMERSIDTVSGGRSCNFGYRIAHFRALAIRYSAIASIGQPLSAMLKNLAQL